MRTYRYTKVKGPNSNQFPSLAWKFVFNGDKIFFTVVRCNPKDNFSKNVAKNLLHFRYYFESNRLYSMTHNDVKRNGSLVNAAVATLEEKPGHFEKRIVDTYYEIQFIKEGYLLDMLFEGL